MIDASKFTAAVEAEKKQLKLKTGWLVVHPATARWLETVGHPAMFLSLEIKPDINVAFRSDNPVPDFYVMDSKALWPGTDAHCPHCGARLNIQVQ